MTVEEAILKIRQVGINKETIYTCYVTEKKKLIGSVDVKDLLTVGESRLIEEIMDENVLCARTLDDQEKVAAMIEKYRDKIINIHPSLIPSFCGVGFYGLKVHEAALQRGVKITGATVHFVDEGMDSGPIILQKAVEVEKGDTPEVLQRRVMEQAEWKILPKAIDMIANGEI